MLNRGYKPIDELLEEANQRPPLAPRMGHNVPIRPPMVRPAEPLDTSPEPQLEVNPPPAPQMQRPPLLDDDTLQNMGMNYAKNYVEAAQDAEDNRVTRADLDRQAEAQRLDALIGQLSNSAAQIGNFRGQKATTTLPDTLKQLSQAEAGNLERRRQLAKDAMAQMDNSVRGLFGLDQKQFEMGKRPFEMNALRNQETKAGFELDNMKEDAEARAREQDANSFESQTARKLAKELGLPVGNQVSAAVLFRTFPMLKQVSDERARKAEIAQRRADNLALLGMKQQEKKDAADAKRSADEEKRVEKQVLELGEIGAKNAWFKDAVDQIDEALGFNLLDYDPKTSTAGGKKVDAPGVSLPFVGRTDIFTVGEDDDRFKVLQANAEKIFNTKLSERSGAAVTNQEMDRLRREFNQGKHDTEELMLGALKAYRIAAVKEMRAREAGFNRKAIEEYQGRPGAFTSKNMGDVPVTDDGAKIEVINGKRYKVYPDGSADPL